MRQRERDNEIVHLTKRTDHREHVGVPKPATVPQCQRASALKPPRFRLSSSRQGREAAERTLDARRSVKLDQGQFTAVDVNWPWWLSCSAQGGLPKNVPSAG